MLVMIVGISVTVDSLNFLQTVMHFLGSLFTGWFLLDSWQYARFLYLWIFFGLFPILLEVGVIGIACKKAYDTDKNYYNTYFMQQNA